MSRLHRQEQNVNQGLVPFPHRGAEKPFLRLQWKGRGKKILQFGEDILTHYRYVVMYVYRGTLYRYISRFSCTKYLNI